MRIRDVMTKDPITVDPDALAIDAQEMMRTRKIRRLPVVQKGKLVGIVTQHMLLQAAPSPATSLSVHELNYLLAKMEVKDIMAKDPVVLPPDMPFEKALSIGQEKGIGGFPVVEDGKLVGITTEGDIVRVLTRSLGLKEAGLRITIEGLGARLGELSEIISVMDRHKTPILSMMSVPRPERNDWMVVIRIKTEETSAIVEELKGTGFNVTYVG